VVGNLIVNRPSAAPDDPSYFVVRVGGDPRTPSWARYRFVNNTIVARGAAPSASQAAWKASRRTTTLSTARAASP